MFSYFYHMKINLLLLVIALIISGASYSQKVKIKKGIATIEGIEYLDFNECKSQSCVVKSLTGENILVMFWESFEKPNPIKRNPKSKAPYNETVTERYSIIKFFGSDVEFESKLTSRKQIVRALYADQLVSSDGKLASEKIDIFLKKHARDISSRRPQVIIVR